ncbi:MAG: hypothetical protein EOM87_00075 [Clostridia bacterium]|nr:hypothetical protein [Clostridia bacterium]
MKKRIILLLGIFIIATMMVFALSACWNKKDEINPYSDRQISAEAAKTALLAMQIPTSASFKIVSGSDVVVYSADNDGYYYYNYSSSTLKSVWVFKKDGEYYRQEKTFDNNIYEDIYTYTRLSEIEAQVYISERLNNFTPNSIIGELYTYFEYNNIFGLPEPALSASEVYDSAKNAWYSRITLMTLLCTGKKVNNLWLNAEIDAGGSVLSLSYTVRTPDDYFPSNVVPSTLLGQNFFSVYMNVSYVLNAEDIVIPELQGSDETCESARIMLMSSSSESYEELTADSGAAITLNAPQEDGRTFEGWYYDRYLLYPVNNEYIVGYDRSDYSVYAKWSQNLTLNLGDGIIYNKYIAVFYNNIPSPVRSGYSFGGWYMDSSFHNPVVNKAYIYGDVTVYAQWNTLYTIDFDVQGLTNKIVPYVDTYDNLDSEDIIGYYESVITIKGKIIEGFYLDASYTQSLPESFNGDSTIYIKLTDVPYIEVNTQDVQNPVVYYINIVDGVTYDTVMGIINTHQGGTFNVGNGETTLDGWYTDSARTVPFTALPASGGVKVYINYVPVE